MADESSTGSPGVMAALKRMSGSVLDLLQTRLDLLVNEIQIQKYHLAAQIRLTLALLVSLLFLILTLVALALVVWWEQRLFVLGFFVLVFLALSLYFFVLLRRNSVAHAPVLMVSLAELQEDLRQLKKAAGHESTSR
ncbi:phage holin family protein [Rhodoferax sp.]|uniref:phage holin family protein n=1 Tax=Rhodoferax sp. TaxID=50421 RepID=UPI00284F1E70|nr:phage holin family protein [Rhodoferax sp.]MDR3371613.1 phage holin family protein [Rhodoferax sp.]